MDTLFVNLVALQAAAPKHANKLDPWQLVMQASPTVKLVMVVLVLMSLICWFIIGAKLFRLERATRQSNQFLDLFWESGAGPGVDAPSGSSRIYSQLVGVQYVAAGQGLPRRLRRARARARQRGQSRAERGAGELDNVERALRRASINEVTSPRDHDPVPRHHRLHGARSSVCSARCGAS